MTFCRNCGAEVGDPANYCPACGAPVAEPDPCDVVLTRCGPNRILTIKEIRAVTGVGLTDAVNISESLPAMLVARTAIASGRDIADQFSKLGATVEVLPHDPERPALGPHTASRGCATAVAAFVAVLVVTTGFVIGSR